MRILYASERPPFPFFLGGAARAAHMLLVRIAAMPGAECGAIGASENAVRVWRYPVLVGFTARDGHSGCEKYAIADCCYSIRTFFIELG